MLEPHLPDFPSLPLELRFLAHCARVVIGTDDGQPLQELAAGITDWNLVIDGAVWHRLESMVYRCLESRPEVAVPKPHLEKLRTLYRANTGRNLLLASTLAKILRTAGDENLAVLPLKGVALAGLLYDDLALRRSRDLDLLVHPRDRAAARALLQRLGFRQVRALNEREERLFFKTDNQLLLEHCDSKVLVELHWAYTTLPALFPLAVDPTAGDLMRIPLAGADLLGLPFADLVPYLCFHGAGHLWFRMFWLCDLAALALREGLDWAKIMARATALNQARATAQGMGMAALLLNDPLPEPVYAHLRRDPAVADLIRRNIRFYLKAPNAHGAYELPYSTRDHIRWRARMVSAPLMKCRIWFHALCQPQIADLRFFGLPRPLFPLYFLLRPLRLALKYLKG